MSSETQYLCGSVVWSAVWFVAGVLSTLAVQYVSHAILSHWRHQ